MYLPYFLPYTLAIVSLQLEPNRNSSQLQVTLVSLPITMASRPEITKQYKACVYDDPGKISTKIEMLDMPEPGPGEVLINLYVLHFCIKYTNK